MEQTSDRLYPSAPLGKNYLEQRLGKKLNDVNSFNNHINNIKEIITYFKDRNRISKQLYQNYKTLDTKSESVETIVIIGATSTSILFKKVLLRRSVIARLIFSGKAAPFELFLE